MESIASDGKMVLGFFLLFKDHVIQLAKLHMDRCDIGEKYLSERCQLDPTVGTGKTVGFPHSVSRDLMEADSTGWEIKRLLAALLMEPVLAIQSHISTGLMSQETS